jgi:hypothetical protein
MLARALESRMLVWQTAGRRRTSSSPQIAATVPASAAA